MAALYTVGFMVVRLLLTQAMGIFQNVWIAGGISALVASVIVAPTLISNLIKGVGSKTGVKVTKDKSCGCDGLVAGFCDLSVAVQARSGGGRGAAQLAVDGGAGDVEQLGELGLGVFAGGVQRQQVLALRGREFGLLAFEFALGSGDGHALAGAQADEVRLKLGHHAEHVEQQPADGIVGVVDAASEIERHSLDGELVGGVPRVRERARQPVELGHHQGVAVPGRGQRFAQPGPGAVRSRQAVVEVDVLVLDSEALECFPLGGEVLLESRDARVADMQVPIVAVNLPSPPMSPYGSCVHYDPSQEAVED